MKEVYRVKWFGASNIIYSYKFNKSPVSKPENENYLQCMNPGITKSLIKCICF